MDHKEVLMLFEVKVSYLGEHRQRRSEQRGVLGVNILNTLKVLQVQQQVLR